MRPSRPAAAPHRDGTPSIFGRAIVLTLLLAFPAGPVEGQLRPLEPVDWEALGHVGRTVDVGGGLYTGQRASLAGTEGRLLELGAFAATWSFGRVAVRLAGTAVRVFDDDQIFAAPLGGVLPFEKGRRRTDAGDYRISTLVGLTPTGSAVGAALRFGIRLPTTDDAKGLGRDQTDFFSSVSGRVAGEAWAVSADVGVGVNGTRDLLNEQIDPLLYALAVRSRSGWVRPFLELVGQHDTRVGPEPRGIENLGEARLGVRVGAARWLRLAAIRGWTRMGPELGLQVRLGARF